MKLKSYNILFRIFSFLSDKTNGAPFFVRYKLLLGTIIVGLISPSIKASKTEIVRDTIPLPPIPTEISCYKIAVTPTPQQSDDIEVKGRVEDQFGELLIGVAIRKKSDPQYGTFSDENGNFTLKAKQDDILIFSYIGLKSKEISVSEIQYGKANIIMEDNGVVMCYDPVVFSTPYVDDVYRRSPPKITKLAYNEVDINPISPVGDIRDFENWVQTKIKYSEQMQNDKVQGQVILSFAVDGKGKLVDKKVIGKLSKDADQEALRALSLSERWEAGIYDRKPIKTTMIITINFNAQ